MEQPLAAHQHTITGLGCGVLLFAPTGQPIPAQGSALGTMTAMVGKP